MELPTYFADFLRNIRPSEAQQRDASAAHKRLRERLANDKELNEITIATFLQGSYRRSTDVKPVGGKKSDVDLIAVTTMAEEQWSAEKALDRFLPFLEKHYSDCYEPQSHSWGLTDGEVELDLVPTSAPSEAVREQFRALRESSAATEIGLPVFEEAIRKTAALMKSDDWQRERLRIPDRDRQNWEDTHPLAQIAWTQAKNARTGGRYVDVVRSMKWWRLTKAPGLQPKGYTVEAIVGICCPDDITSIGQGFHSVCQMILQKFSADVAAGRTPNIPDRGVPSNNVLKRIRPDDFHDFYRAVSATEPLASAALREPNAKRSAALWREIFGPEFPASPDDEDERKGFIPPPAPPTRIGRGNFA